MEPNINFNYYSILIFTSICTILFLLYLSMVIYYISKNYHKKKLCIFWIDYCTLIFGGILFTIIYLFQFFVNGKDNRINELKKLSTNFFPPALVISLSFMCFTLISTLLFDAITSIRLSIKMHKMKSINELDLFFLSEKLNNIDYADILKMKSHHIYNIVFIIINLVLITLEIFVYTDLYFKLSLKIYFNYIMRIYHFIVLIFLLISIIIMNKNKKLLLKKEYNNPNRIAQKLYDAHFCQIVYFTDVISFKLVADLIMNIPASIFMANRRFDTFTLVWSELSIFLYIFFGGSEYFVIDKDSKAGKTNKMIKKLFCLKKLDFHFGEKDVKKIIDDFNFDYSLEERRILENLNIEIIKKAEIHLFKDDDWTNTSVIEMQNSDTNLNKIINSPKQFIEFKLISEFYLVQKLIMLYFDKNSSKFERAMRAMEESGSAFKNIEKERKNTLTSISNLLNLTVDTVNQISSNEGKKLINILDFSPKELFNSFEGKELLEELKNNYEFDYDDNIFQVESLFSSTFFNLFPFYQMSIKTILQSINPTNNIKLFEKFIKNNKNNTENYTVSSKNNIINIKNNTSENNININTTLNDTKVDNSVSNNSYASRIININSNNNINNNINNKKINKNNNNIENNLYYTFNLYFMYEIYDVSELADIKELKNIINEYYDYIILTVKTMSYTFLPLILGIFKLRIFDSEKIIILYRNPLYFSNLGHFNRWVNFYLTEEREKIKVSSIFNDIINLNVIEINNSIQLFESDFNEVKLSIEQDFSFLEKIGKVFPILHLFIGEEIGLSQDVIDKRLQKEGHINFNDNSILFEENSKIDFEPNSLKNKEKEKEFIILDMSDNNNITMPIFNDSIESEDKFNLTTIDETNSLMDKEYLFVNGNILRTIKIYFTNLFRKDCELNKKEKNVKLKLDSNSYCVYLKDQLINYLIKKSLFNTNDEIEEDEKEDLISNKEQNNDKIKKNEKEEKKDDFIENIKMEKIEENNIDNDV